MILCIVVECHELAEVVDNHCNSPETLASPHVRVVSATVIGYVSVGSVVGVRAHAVSCVMYSSAYRMHNKATYCPVAPVLLASASSGSRVVSSSVARCGRCAWCCGIGMTWCLLLP